MSITYGAYDVYNIHCNHSIIGKNASALSARIVVNYVLIVEYSKMRG